MVKNSSLGRLDAGQFRKIWPSMHNHHPAWIANPSRPLPQIARRGLFR